MGVDDVETPDSPVHEEELFFGDSVVSRVTKLPRGGLQRGLCILAAVLGSLLAFCLGLSPHSFFGVALWRSAPTPCDAMGSCELWSLLYDPEIHELVAENLVLASTPTLTRADLPMVKGLVRESFANITVALEEKAPKVVEELGMLKINGTIKMYIAEALGLVADPRVQAFGRHVARAVRNSPLSFHDEEDLKRHIVKNLWHHLDALQRFQREQVGWHTQAIWSLGARSQWDLTLDIEAMGWVEAVSLASSGAAKKPEAGNTGVVGLDALEGGAFAEGRTLLDLMLMCVRSKGEDWDTDLHGAVEAFSSRLSAPCEPEGPGGDSSSGADSAGAFLVCPLKYGMLGMDALRYASTMDRKPERASCRSPGVCPLRGLFFDQELYRSVAKGLVGQGAPLLGERDTEDAARLVGKSFQKISRALQRHAPQVGDELNELTMNATTMKQLLRIMELTSDAQVQGVGRYVARAMVAGRPYAGAPELKRHLAQSLEGQMGSIQQLLEERVPEGLHKIWAWARDRHWELAMAVEKAEVFGAGTFASDLESDKGLSRRDAAISGGALENGRVLLDIMLICLRSNPAYSTVLGEAEELFAGPLSAKCHLEGTVASEPTFASALVCPLKFGMLGIDVLRFVESASLSKDKSCHGPGACVLSDVFFDPFVQERAVADIIGAAADPSMLLGRSEMPQVRQAVVAAFKNISTEMQKQTPSLAGALRRIRVNETVKQYVFEAWQLMTDLHVQEIGRHVARALRSGDAFGSLEQLRVAVVRNLWRSFPDIQRLQATVSRYAVREVWRSASSPQLELTYELEKARTLRPKSAEGKALRQREALVQAAWQEGRTLLDITAAFVHSGLGDVAFVAPPMVPCDPDMAIGRDAGFQSALVCPLRFGVIGMDVLRFTDSIFTWTQVDQRSCKDRGMCPLSRFFFDDFVRGAAGADLLRIAGGRVPVQSVEKAVDMAFRNVSVHVHLYAPGVAENLLAEQADESQKERFIAAMQLVSDPQVQAFGRSVAAALRNAADFRDVGELKRKVVQFLGPERLAAMRNFTLSRVDKRVLGIWGWGQADQWSMSVDTETINSMKADPSPRSEESSPDANSTHESPEEEALAQAALVEGRVLLDLLMMRIHGLHTSLSSSLYGAMDVFAPALVVACSLGEPGAHSESLRQVLVCPLKFGALGLDAMRYAVSQLDSLVADGV